MFYIIKKSINHIAKNILFQFTVIFLGLTFISFLSFKFNNKSFIWPYDGLTIQYPAFMYLGQFIRECFRNLSNGNISLYDFNIGMGTDVIQFLGMWYFEPLAFFSAFVPSDYTEILYNIIVIVRFYLVGISFLTLCRHLKKWNTYALIGAVIYTFSGYTFYFIKHPIFLWGLIYLPIFVILIDKIILDKRLSLKFSILTGISIFTAYQLFYINTLLIGIYILISCFSKYRLKKWKTILKIFAKILLSYIIGIGTACVTFLPVFIGYLNSNRTASVVSAEQLFSYGSDWISKFFVYLVAPNKNVGYWLYNGYAVIVLVAIILLFQMRKKYGLLKKLFIIATVMFSIPLFTFILFGFNSINHRWSYAYGLILAVIALYTLEYLSQLKPRQFFPLICIGIIYTVSILSDETLRSWETYLACIMFWALLSVILYLSLLNVPQHYWRQALLCMTILICSINGLFTYSSKYGNYVAEFEDKDYANQDLFNSSSNIKIDDTSFYRRDCANNDRNHINTAMVSGYNGISICSNQMSKYLFDFNKVFENRNYALAEMYDLDNRTFLETLCGVKYFTLFEGQENDLPYGFSQTGEVESRGIKIYENENFLPLGFTYPGYINYEDYCKMPSYQKQEALLQGCVLNDKENLKEYDEISPQFSSEVIDFSLSTDEFVAIDKNFYYVGENGTTLTFSCNGVKNSEVYFRTANFNCDNLALEDITVIITGISESKTVSKTFNVRNAANQYTSGRYNYLVNLGFFEDEIKEIQVTLPVSGEYQIDDFEIICQPMESNYSEYVDKLNHNILENVSIEGNHINGSISLNNDEILYLYIPYSKGWTANVDGKPVEILRANEMFMALPLTTGNHTIELNYVTPGLSLGIIISGMSCLIIFFVYLIRRRFKN